MEQEELSNKNEDRGIWADLTEEEYKEALSEKNKQEVKDVLGHEPTDEELLHHYLEIHPAIRERLGGDTLKILESEDDEDGNALKE
jgi:predicted house-cleaning noncanonical NTP pyrophosphatase (MazG superfamily)